MGTLITEQQCLQFYPNLFIYDLEYVGVPNNLNKCYIWEIGAIHVATGAVFSITMDPGIRPLPPPMSEEFANVTEDFLKRKSACLFEYGWQMFLNFVNARAKGAALLVAHNNFKSDKVMMEVEAKRRKLQLPLNWFFFDSLLFCRKAIPKQTSYTLHDLYFSLLRKKIVDNHSALPDARALLELLTYIGLQRMCGPIYPSFCTSLQVIKWLGPSCERILFENNIRCLEQLISNIIVAFSQHNISQFGQQTQLLNFVQYYISNYCGITSGNSNSISNSIIEKWLPVV